MEWPRDGRWTWENVRRQVAAQEDLDENLRTQTLIAIDRLELHLGRDWASTRAPGLHPIDELVGNVAPWTRHRLIELAAVMDAVEADPRWIPSLRGRIRHPREAAHAFFELDLARAALSAGLTVALQPLVAGGRVADLAVSDGDGRLLVEITAIDDLSSNTQDELAFQDRVCPVPDLVSHGLTFGCELVCLVPKREREDVLQRMHAFWRERIESKTPGRIQIPGVLVAWAAPVEDGESCARYLALGPKEGFSGPIEDRTGLRVRRAVRGKVAQLPSGEQNLLILRPPSMLIHEHALSDLGSWLSLELGDLPRLAGVALTIRALGQFAEGIRSQDRRHARVRVLPESEIFVRCMLIVLHESRVTDATKRILDRWFPS